MGHIWKLQHFIEQTHPIHPEWLYCMYYNRKSIWLVMYCKNLWCIIIWHKLCHTLQAKWTCDCNACNTAIQDVRGETTDLFKRPCYRIISNRRAPPIEEPPAFSMWLLRQFEKYHQPLIVNMTLACYTYWKYVHKIMMPNYKVVSKPLRGNLYANCLQYFCFFWL